jgi:hypothetical protein
MSKSLVRQVVEGARVLVGARPTWTRHTLALTRNNRECDPTDAKAARFCAYGALVRSAYDLTGDAKQARQLAGRAAMLITGRDNPHEAFGEIYSINDGPAVSSRNAIVHLFDKSMELV